ncbi:MULTISPECIES: hypothetical protein [unclassified Streptomyces]|uniref:hypothetical protein n=1 Tax=unclassified Streptomyces TaxID=2593676 RepID=UPI00109EC9C1|nr:hypothetical protein [Streptomyces sp. A1136]THA46436.1 hypothetical protein E6R62_33945 [Streptomyces sp. A1136]
MSMTRDAATLTDRDERALVAAAERRISEPLRFGAAVDALRALGRFARRGFTAGRPRGHAQGRESLSWQTNPLTPPGPAPTAR